MKCGSRRKQEEKTAYGYADNVRIDKEARLIEMIFSYVDDGLIVADGDIQMNCDFGEHRIAM